MSRHEAPLPQPSPFFAAGEEHGSPDAELAAILPEITGPDGQFRHRQHINLAFLAVRRYGMPEASASATGSGTSPRTSGRRRSTTTRSPGPG